MSNRDPETDTKGHAPVTRPVTLKSRSEQGVTPRDPGVTPAMGHGVTPCPSPYRRGTGVTPVTFNGQDRPRCGYCMAPPVVRDGRVGFAHLSWCRRVPRVQLERQPLFGDNTSERNRR